MVVEAALEEELRFSILVGLIMLNIQVLLKELNLKSKLPLDQDNMMTT